MNKYQDDSLALHTDLYQLNMVKTYWKDNIHNRRAIFEVFFRKMPFEGGYAVFAGLERIIDYINSFKFSKSDIDYLRELGYEEDFLSYLSSVKFTGKIRSCIEGELVFANEPILQVDTTLAEAQLIETPLLNIINFQTLIATKASRIKNVARNQYLYEDIEGAGKKDETVMEFGTRRAQELDAAIWGTRAAIIGGFDATSNVRAGKIFDIPVAGTHAHAMVQVYNDEYTAFTKYAQTHKNCIFLVDTYDTLKSGVPNAIRVAKEMGNKINFVGIRLDSGKLTYLSKETRKMLDIAGFKNAKIFASNDLDEYSMLSLKADGAKIDGWGVGTKLITAFDQPALGAVYKLVSIENENGEMEDTMKLSEIPEKITTPGLKKVYRIINKNNGKSEGDYVAMDDEKPWEETKLKMFHPVYPHISKFVTNFDAVEVHKDIFVEGKLVYDSPSVSEMKNYCQKQLELLWDDYKVITSPTEYPVDLSQKCWDNKMKNIEKIREKVNNNLK